MQGAYTKTSTDNIGTQKQVANISFNITIIHEDAR